MAFIMAKNKDVARRQQLLAARADYLARMTDRARRTFERRAALPAPTQKDSVDPETEGILVQEVRNLIAEAHRLRAKAEYGRDIRAALRGVDTALKALELYARATGQIRDQRGGNVTVNVVATREEGIQTAAELLMDLASAAELTLLIRQLQDRLAELEHANQPHAGPSQPQLLAAPTPEEVLAPLPPEEILALTPEQKETGEDA